MTYRFLPRLIMTLLGAPHLLWPCSCGHQKPACAYLDSDVIFIGRVSFTNDDGSGSVAQATLVRLNVEERFKGVADDVKEIWIDPGSFESCYAEYRLGLRYLMIARWYPSMPAQMRTGKPLPKGFDAARTKVYLSDECSGSRAIDGSLNIDQDLAMLRAYRAGVAVPKVLGHIVLYPFRGWPVLSGPTVEGARVKISNSSTTLETRADSKGSFSLQSLHPGHYQAKAEIVPYRQENEASLDVPATGCGYIDIPLATASSLEGVVLDHEGKPMSKTDVHVQSKDTDQRNEFSLRSRTDETGHFAIAGLPEQDVYLSTGEEYPTSDRPYPRVYYPARSSSEKARAIRLSPGEHRNAMVLWVGRPARVSRVNAFVVGPAGDPERDVSVRALGPDGNVKELVNTSGRGDAIVPCLLGYRYELDDETAPAAPQARQVTD